MGVQVPLSAPKFCIVGAFSACPKNYKFANLCLKGMKIFRLLFAVCLGVPALCDARGVEYDDIVRAASRTTATNISNTSPMRGTNAITSSQKAQTTIGTRAAPTSGRERTAVVTNDSRTASRAVSTRSGANVVSRTNTPATSVVTRGATMTNISTRGSAMKSRSATTQTPRRMTSRTTATSARLGGRNMSRAATNNESGGLNTNYTRCREIYYDCMDEFCANKDANLRRCACSSRATEFDDIKKQISKFEDKMLDFNQRLLLVNMDAEDVMAINTPTAGEDAFYATDDKTKSKQALDDIAKKLNATFGDDSSGTSLSPISLSLNIDSAFDTVDSFMGSDTTAKSGVALYNAAIPICRETAMEVCTEDELSLAISGYTMLMEQDCNTVQKAYQTQLDTARTKVFESGALLDMSRLDAYQTRNSDDILTCKRKMMNMLTNDTVCGKNMGKCLDMTGKYIDPTTGTAFLTSNLADLGDLIIRPDANQSWTSANGAGKFITYLTNKKHFITPATENCQAIADNLWNEFIEDALAQIKLAQTAKLEEIRQACTTLVTECLTNASDSIGEFDARALSVFGVSADRTVNTMCNDVRNACTALMESGNGAGWESGVSGIATSKTYDTIISSCTQVGRNCIIQSCRSISGNFDLCDDVQFSPNRHAILERTACWPAVLSCVGAAGDDALIAIMTSLGKDATDDFYDDLYTRTDPNPYDICEYDGHCNGNSGDAECAKCRIAERIWGHCEAAPTDTIPGEGGTGHNHIIMPKTVNDTLLSWFAINTGTANSTGTASDANSCINTRCTSDLYHPGVGGPNNLTCIPDNGAGDITSDGLYCPAPHQKINVTSNITNCCYAGTNGWGHRSLSDNACCETGNVRDNICMPKNVTKYKVIGENNDKKLVCVGDNKITGGGATDTGFPAGDQVKCNGTYIYVENNKYTEPSKNGTGVGGTAVHYAPKMRYYPNNDNKHEDPQDVTSGIQSWFINYESD